VFNDRCLYIATSNGQHNNGFKTQEATIQFSERGHGDHNESADGCQLSADRSVCISIINMKIMNRRVNQSMSVCQSRRLIYIEYCVCLLFSEFPARCKCRNVFAWCYLFSAIIELYEYVAGVSASHGVHRPIRIKHSRIRIMLRFSFRFYAVASFVYTGKIEKIHFGLLARELKQGIKTRTKTNR